MSMRCIVTSPNGTELDLSALLEIGHMGSVSWAPETDLTVMAHNDMTLALDNSEGKVEDYLGSAAPGDIYEVVLSRQRSDGSGWDRVFGGVMDLPYSLVYDDKAKTASIHCYSFSKLLERTSAEPLKRTLASKTASITAATKVLVFISGETADLAPGDIVSLDDGAGHKEDFTIDKITSATNTTTILEAGNSFSAVAATVTTPYHHDKTPAYLLDLVADECGLELDASDLEADVASFPIATPISLDGLNLTEIPRSLVPTGTSISATYSSTDETNRKTLSSPSGTWADGSASNTPQGDWTPYLTSEPAGIMASTLGGNYDNGASAWDHTNSHVYYIVEELTGSPTFLRRLRVYKDSSDMGIFRSIADGEDYENEAIEYDPVNGRVWVSFQDTLGTREVRYIPEGGGAFTTFLGSTSAGLRLCREHNLLILVDDNTGVISMYDLTSLSLVRQITFDYGFPLAWTFRAWDNWLAFLYEQDGTTRVAIYDTDNWEFVAAYLLSPSRGVRQFLTVWTLSDGRQVGAAWAGAEWFVLSLRYDGVVRYADFEGDSCGAAARNLALVTNCVVNVDEFKQLSVKNRMNLGTSDVMATLATPIESSRRPVSEVYRASVEVTGKSPAGLDIDIIVGETGDSARRLSVKCDLATTAGVAVAAAIGMQQFFGSVREQRDVTVADAEDVYRFGDAVELGGKRFTVYKGELDLEQNTQQLMLLEVVS